MKKKKEIKEILKESYQYKEKERIQELRNKLRDIWTEDFNKKLIDFYGPEAEQSIEIAKKYPESIMSFRGYSVTFEATGVDYSTTLVVKNSMWNYDIMKMTKPNFNAPVDIMSELKRLTEEESEFKKAMGILQRKGTSDNELINNFPELC